MILLPDFDNMSISDKNTVYADDEHKVYLLSTSKYFSTSTVYRWLGLLCMFFHHMPNILLIKENEEDGLCELFYLQAWEEPHCNQTHHSYFTMFTRGKHGKFALIITCSFTIIYHCIHARKILKYIINHKTLKFLHRNSKLFSVKKIKIIRHEIKNSYLSLSVINVWK